VSTPGCLLTSQRLSQFELQIGLLSDREVRRYLIRSEVRVQRTEEFAVLLWGDKVRVFARPETKQTINRELVNCGFPWAGFEWSVEAGSHDHILRFPFRVSYFSSPQHSTSHSRLYHSMYRRIMLLVLCLQELYRHGRLTFNSCAAEG
jgi:hypothetical protein